LQKRIGFEPAKIVLGGGEQKIVPWERRGLAGSFAVTRQWDASDPRPNLPDDKFVFIRVHS